MVRWADIPAGLIENFNRRQFKPFGNAQWVTAPRLTDARVAVITTAAIHRADDRPFAGHEGDYRIIPGDIDYADLNMTHSSINFDRSAYQQDVNVCFPLEHLQALKESGERSTDPSLLLRLKRWGNYRHRTLHSQKLTTIVF